MTGLVDYNFFNYDVIDKSYKIIDKLEDWKEVKLFGLLFTASWCPPCIEFESKLLAFYNEVNTKSEKGKVFEVIHIASEKNENDFKHSIEKLDWVFLRYNDRNIQTLAEDLNLVHIPCLFIFNDDGILLVSEGRNDITTLQTKEIWEKWINKLVEKENMDIV